MRRTNLERKEWLKKYQVVEPKIHWLAHEARSNWCEYAVKLVENAQSVSRNKKILSKAQLEKIIDDMTYSSNVERLFDLEVDFGDGLSPLTGSKLREITYRSWWNQLPDDRATPIWDAFELSDPYIGWDSLVPKKDHECVNGCPLYSNIRLFLTHYRPGYQGVRYCWFCTALLLEHHLECKNWLLTGGQEAKVRMQIMDSVREELKPQVKNELRAEIRAEVMAELLREERAKPLVASRVERTIPTATHKRVALRVTPGVRKFLSHFIETDEKIAVIGHILPESGNPNTYEGCPNLFYRAYRVPGTWVGKPSDISHRFTKISSTQSFRNMIDAGCFDHLGTIENNQTQFQMYSLSEIARQILKKKV